MSSIIIYVYQKKTYIIKDIILYDWIYIYNIWKFYIKLFLEYLIFIKIKARADIKNISKWYAIYKEQNLFFCIKYISDININIKYWRLWFEYDNLICVTKQDKAKQGNAMPLHASLFYNDS